jgi:hypothetical protein
MNAILRAVCQCHGNLISDALEIASPPQLGNVTSFLMLLLSLVLLTEEEWYFHEALRVIAHYRVEGFRPLRKMTQPIARNRPMNTIHGYKRDVCKALLPTDDVETFMCATFSCLKVTCARNFTCEKRHWHFKRRHKVCRN